MQTSSKVIAEATSTAATSIPLRPDIWSSSTTDRVETWVAAAIDSCYVTRMEKHAQNFCRCKAHYCVMRDLKLAGFPGSSARRTGSHDKMAVRDKI